MEKNIMRIATVNVSQEVLLSALGMDSGDGRADKIDKLRTAGLEIARPVSLYIPVQPELADGEVLIGGERFREPFVYEMLSGSQTVVPYVATCGTEIDEWSKQFRDPFEHFAVSKLKELCLFRMLDELMNFVKESYFDKTKNISAINPGSIREWPLTGQVPLFAVLGSEARDIGVSLSDALWMTPHKSVSGIMFQSDSTYENCQLCPRLDCPNRRADYIG